SVTILGPSAATSLVALVPVAALLLGIPVLGEIPSVAECAAMGAVVIGVFLAARPAKPFRAPRPHGTP
ncbi:MAG: DMT family transporter, partial [Achromobacter pestifer]